MSDSTLLFAEKINPNDEFVILLEWSVQDGQPVKRGQVVAHLESSKAAYEFEAPGDGYIQHLVSAGAKAKFDQPIGKLWNHANFKKQVATIRSKDGEVVVTAKAKRLMQQHGLTQVHFLGLPRVTEQDVQKLLSRNSDSVGASQSSGGVKVSGQLKPLEPTKEFEVAALRRAQTNFISSSLTKELRFEVIEEVLAKLREQGRFISTGELVTWAAARALMSHAAFNCARRSDGIFYYDAINIGVAVNIGKGLKVPVIKNAEQRSVQEISVLFKEFTLKYLRDELRATDLTDGTFTVTDLSSLGVRSFDPVVHEGQAAILGVCSPDASKKLMNLVLTFNHEIVDGMAAARFLTEIERLILTVS